MNGLYEIGFLVVAVPVFLAIWALAIESYGLVLGLGLGWLPALVVALIAGGVWPVLLLSLLAPTLLLVGF